MMNIEHFIQRDIVELLAKNDSLRFAQMKPQGMESNIFTYHLHQLLQQKIIRKEGAYYSLDDTGLQHVDMISFSTGKTSRQPKVIAVIVLSCYHCGKHLFAKRKCQPYIDTYMHPSGKMHFGEMPSGHVRRELVEKLGICFYPMQRGIVTIKISNGTQPLTQVIAFVYSATIQSCDKSFPESDRFVYEWHEVDDLSSMRTMPGTREVLRIVQESKGLFIEEINTEIK